MTRKSFVAGAIAVIALGLFAGPVGAVIPGVGAISKKNMEWKWNYEETVGSDIEFFEYNVSGTLKRYALVGAMGNGFSIYDITDPSLPPIPQGKYVTPGVSWQGDVQVNPKRKIAILAIQTPGATAWAPLGGIEIVDISNVLAPLRLSAISPGSGAAHNSTIVHDNYVYTINDPFIIDITNPSAPVNKGRLPSSICSGHDLTVDPNNPGIAYMACGSSKTQIINISDPAKPTLIKEINDTKISIAHQADPAPDSSFIVISDERNGGLGIGAPPQGGGHVYDISGKYIAGASITNPKKMGIWFAPFFGLTGTSTAPSQWGNVTMHNFTFQSERYLLSTGWYTAGSWVADMQTATTATNPDYTEWGGNQNANGKTTWGNTRGNILLEGDEVWSTKWTRFDDPRYDRLLYNSGLTRGFDVLQYNGPMPKKIARLRILGAAGGTVTGKLDRYAVWTHTGWENRPLPAGKSITVSAGGASATVTTAADGSFSAALGLPAGTHSVTATWAGDDVYQPASVTQSVSV